MTRAAFAAVDNRLDRDSAKARERQDAALLQESARCVVVAFQGMGTADQQANRLKALIGASCDAYEALVGSDDAHPYLSGLGKATGYRLTTSTASAKARGEAVFKAMGERGGAA